MRRLTFTLAYTTMLTLWLSWTGSIRARKLAKARTRARVFRLPKVRVRPRANLRPKECANVFVRVVVVAEDPVVGDFCLHC